MAGDSIAWDKSFADYPASDGWELSYYMRSQAGKGSDLDIVFGTEVLAVGDGFEIRIPASRTVNLLAGPYSLFSRLTDGSTTVTSDPMAVTGIANPATSSGAKSHARTMRDLLRAALEETAEDAGYVSYTYLGRTIELARGDAEAKLAHWEYLVVVEAAPDERLSHAVTFVDE